MPSHIRKYIHIAKLNRKGETLEKSPIHDWVSSRNIENIKSSIRNWLRIGYKADEVELKKDSRHLGGDIEILDVAEFLGIDPMEEA